MKKLHKLKIDTSFPFKTIGISSHENDYRLIWAVNACLNISFVRIADFEAIDSKKVISAFSRYFFEDQDRYYAFYIVSNRCHNGYLVPEFRNIDYFLFLKGDFDPGYLAELVRKLKQTAIVSAAFIIDNNSIKSLKKLAHLDG